MNLLLDLIASFIVGSCGIASVAVPPEVIQPGINYGGSIFHHPSALGCTMPQYTVSVLGDIELTEHYVGAPAPVFIRVVADDNSYEDIPCHPTEERRLYSCPSFDTTQWTILLYAVQATGRNGYGQLVIFRSENLIVRYTLFVGDAKHLYLPLLKGR